MSSTVIRVAAVGDVATMDHLLGQLAEALGDQDEYNGDTEALERHGFGQERLFYTLLAERDHAAIGMCIYFPEFSTWRSQAGVFVQDLIVVESARGEGAGRRLLAAAMSDGTNSWGARYLRLAVGVTNHAGIDFYHRLGMVADHDNHAMLLADDAVANLVAGTE